MNTIARLFFTFALGVAANLHAAIFESNNLADITPHVNSETLVIFDLDDTVFRAPSMLGNDAWVTYQLNIKVKQGLTYDQATQEILPLYYIIQYFTQLELIDSKTTELFRDLQNKNIKVMALTARSMPLVDRTQQELERMGIFFSKTAPYTHDLALGITHAARYSNGIIFGANNDKGKLLFQFLDTVGYQPKKIIFIDDKSSNVQILERVVESHGIAFVGVRYSHEDVRKTIFDPAVADQLLQEFKERMALSPLKKDPCHDQHTIAASTPA